MTAVPEQETTLYDLAVIGAGYVGVPLAATFAEADQRVLLIDVQPTFMPGGGLAVPDGEETRRLHAGVIVASPRQIARAEPVQQVVTPQGFEP